MARSRRKYKNSRTKVRVGLPKKKPGIFKPAIDIPPALAAAAGEKIEWDSKGTVLRNYRSFGVVANPNLLGVRARTPHIVQSSSLQVPVREAPPVSEFDPIDSGSDLESDGRFLFQYQSRKKYDRSLHIFNKKICFVGLFLQAGIVVI